MASLELYKKRRVALLVFSVFHIFHIDKNSASNRRCMASWIKYLYTANIEKCRLASLKHSFPASSRRYSTISITQSIPKRLVFL